jgi:hypothetical protein
MTKRRRVSAGRKSAPGWRIPDAVRDESTAWCRQHQRVYEKELAKAIVLWIRSSSTMRELTERAVANDPLLGPEFWTEYTKRCELCAYDLQKWLWEQGLKRSAG